MSERNFILATAGHVDHGKSTLIKALTGIDPDRLPEEKARGITIELGFAQLALDDFSLGIIDVPGHEDFVKNMVAGVGAIDLALLVVAADDGWMPQTEEHLQILSYLGVRHLVVGLTKSDLVDSVEVVSREIREQLRLSLFADAPIVPVAAARQIGLSELREALVRELSTIAPPRVLDRPRLAIDRVFSLRGVGTVVTGTVADGSFSRGDSIRVQPSGRVAKIRALQNHNREIEHVGHGQRAAISIPDLSVAQVKRGDVIISDRAERSTCVLEVLLERSARLPAKTAALKNGAHLWIHHGSAHDQVRVFFQETDALAAGEATIAQLRFDLPIFLRQGDRLVARDSSQRETVAGGLVLAADASVRGFRSELRRAFLCARAAAPNDPAVFIETQVQRDQVADRNELLIASGFSASEIADGIVALSRAGKVIVLGDAVIDAALWQSAKQQTIDAIDAFHRANPNLPGLPLADLRVRWPRRVAMQLSNIIADLAVEFLQTGEFIARRSHRPALPPALRLAAEKIKAALAAKPFDPPSRRDLGRDPATQEALRFLRDQKEVVELGGEVVLLEEKFATMRELVIAALKKNGSATAGELRQTLGTSRRVIIPFLERLDRDGVTRRAGDKRVLAR